MKLSVGSLSGFEAPNGQEVYRFSDTPNQCLPDKNNGDALYITLRPILLKVINM